MSFFGPKLRFLENCIAKCTMHSFCEGARPTEEIFATVSGDSNALPLSLYPVALPYLSHP